MASAQQNRLARLSRMDWAEVRVRTRQEFQKHRDLLMHRLGVRHAAIRLNPASAVRRGKFFFSDNEAQSRVELIREYLPDRAKAIVREADEICGHRFRLLGYENLSFTLDSRGGDGSAHHSTDINWHLDPVNRKQAPLQTWFKIPFLDFAAVGDHKVIWELNRHQHLVTLAKAQLLTGDSKYIHELIAQWRSWIRANPYPLGINWASTLEVAFRSLSWVWVDRILAATPEYSEFRAELLPELAFHGRYIEHFLSTYFSPNTHLLGEALALFFIGTLYPQMPGAENWKKSGWRILVSEAARQVRPDGVYFEQSLYYHVYALDFFLHARLLAARNDIAIPPSYDLILGRMLDVVAALAQGGPAEGFGDDDGGRLFDPRRNRTEYMTDPLAIGALTYSRNFDAAELTEEAIWLFGNRAVEFLSQEKPAPVAQSTAFPNGGLYVLADPQRLAQAMVVDAGPQGEGRSGHGHADALSLNLTMDGQRCLVDAGTGVYTSKDPADRDAFRGTGAHNALRVDGVDQAVADGPFSWTHIPSAIAEKWIVGKSFTYFAGSHNGYERLADPVTHRRHVLMIAGGPTLVRDVVSGQAGHDLEIRWHFAPHLEVNLEVNDDSRSTGSRQVEISRAGSAPVLSLIMPEGSVWQTVTEVSRTLLSPAYGNLQPAPVVRCHANVQLPTETATALVLKSGATRKDDVPRLASMAQTGVQVYELNYDDVSYGFFFAVNFRLNSALNKDPWSFGPWSSDALVLYCHIEKEKLTHLVAIGATSVAWQGQPLLSMDLKAEGSSEFFEWRRGKGMSAGTAGGTTNSGRGNFSVTPLFEQLTGEAVTEQSCDGSPSSSSTYAEKH